MSLNFHSQLFTDYPELAGLSKQDLEQLVSDPEYFQSVFYSLTHVKDTLQSQVDLGRANADIANRTLALQDHLYKLRAETQQSFDEAKLLEGRSKQLEREQRDLHQRYTPSFLHMRLKHSVTSQDELSEVTATAFVRGTDEGGAGNDMEEKLSNKDVDDFIKTFKAQRVTYHKRVMWSEHWNYGKVTWIDD